jgi:hypothetical protein
MSFRPMSPQMPQGGRPSIPTPAPPAAPGMPDLLGGAVPGRGGNQDQINQALYQLWMQTSDPTVLEYITSGWTTPVSPAVQQAVSRIVGRQVPAGGVPAPGIGAQTAVAPAYLNPPSPGQASQQAAGPQPAGPNPAPGGGISEQGSQGFFSSPPPAAGMGAVGLGLNGPGYNDTPLPAMPNPGLGDRFAANENYMQQFFSNQQAAPGGAGGAIAQAIKGAQDRTAAAVQSAATPAGGTTVSAPTPFAPNSQNPLIDPAAGSAVGQAGYGAALAEDPGAQAAVLAKIMGDLGVNLARPGLYTGNLVKAIQPYFQTFLRYYGLTDNQPTADRAQAITEQFRGMLGSQGTFGQIQQSARDMLGGLPGVLGRINNPARQMSITDDILGMLTAGNNDIAQEAAQQDNRRQQLLFRIAGLDPANANQQWPDFLRQQAATGQLPGGDLLAQILGGAVAGR